MGWKFAVGDRVRRLADVYDQRSRALHGAVLLRYSDYESTCGPYPELYMVKWDDGSIGKAYLPHGLDAEAWGPSR